MKNLKKISCIILSLMILMLTTGLAVFSAGSTMKITLRIEGIDANVFYKTIEVPYSDALTIKDALLYIDAQEDSIAITGADSAYITDINGVSAGKFGGWDGWMYRVNDADPAVGIDSFKLSVGDHVVLYYGDPFGVGMQFPVIDTSRLSEGIIKFTSTDNVLDENFNTEAVVNPVAGAKVTWHFNDTEAVYTTDNNGEIKIVSEQLTPGKHIIQMSKTNSEGLPLVLRYAPDYFVEVEGSETTAHTTTAPDETTTSSTTTSATVQTTAAQGSDALSTKSAVTKQNTTTTETESPKTSDASGIIIPAGAISIALIYMFNRKRVNEK